jgi:Putative transposase of IS4/5 family (DUF4096)
VPGCEATVGVTAADHGRFLDAVLYRYRTGMPWRDLPQRLGNFRVLHTEIAKARRWAVRDKARVLFPNSLAPFEVIRDWEAFDADIGKDSARKSASISFPTSAIGKTTTRISKRLTG